MLVRWLGGLGMAKLSGEKEERMVGWYRYLDVGVPFSIWKVLRILVPVQSPYFEAGLELARVKRVVVSAGCVFLAVI